jgi:hypothetical protein
MELSILEKPVVDHPAKKFSRNQLTPNVRYRVHRNLQMVPILNQLNPVHTVTSYCKISTLVLSL